VAENTDVHCLDQEQLITQSVDVCPEGPITVEIVCLSVCLPACLPVCLSACLSVSLFVCLTVCLLSMLLDVFMSTAALELLTTLNL